ncbi:MAG TPA: DNA polymerase III subunit delta [Vicinamibacterales bacterium]|nr:DNA polymerase III subunit delta [Vicinamibacterales bacterium]
MPALTPSALRQQIASRTVGPLYLIHGSDEAEKSALAVAFADLVEPELRAFNVERLYGGEIKPAEIVDAARTLPMMADRRVVLVLQAERTLQPKRESEAAAETLDVFIEYLKKPSASTVLVLVIGEPLDARRKVTQVIEERAVIVETGAIASGAEAERLVKELAATRGMIVDRAAIRRLIELAGGNGAKLRADTERVLTYVGEGTVTAEDVDAVATEEESSDDVWAVVRAVERGDARAALRELRLRFEAGDTPYGLLGQIAWAVRQPRRFSPARLPGAIDALFRTDVALKSSGGDARALLERLVVELCGR